MNTTEPMYNLYFLGNITSLNIEEGINQNGSRRAYFNELSIFENNIQHILERLLVKRPKRERLADLSELLWSLFFSLFAIQTFQLRLKRCLYW